MKFYLETQIPCFAKSTAIEHISESFRHAFVFGPNYPYLSHAKSQRFDTMPNTSLCM